MENHRSSLGDARGTCTRKIIIEAEWCQVRVGFGSVLDRKTIIFIVVRDKHKFNPQEQ